MSVSAKESLILGLGKLVWLSLPVLFYSFPAWSQQPMDQTAKSALADSQGTQASAGGQQHAAHQAGSISGKVVDQTGVDIAGAVVKLTREGQSLGLEVTSDEDGLFSFSNVAPGPFHLTISSPDLASHEFSGTRNKKSSGYSGCSRTSMSATNRMPLLSRRNTSLSLRGNQLPTRSRLSGLGPWPGLTRPEIVGARTGRERKDMQSAMARVTPMFLPQRLSEAR